MSPDNDPQKLRIAMLAYRGKPHVGGQGVYVREISKALVELGHTVEVSHLVEGPVHRPFSAGPVIPDDVIN